jgi:hypothetical protein
MKKRWMVGALVACGVLWGTAASASWWSAVLYAYGSNSLEYSNGQKIVTGKYNILHAVYQDLGAIKYMNSTDGLTWTTPAVLACGPSKHPAIAIDGLGKIGVVWEDESSGSLYYAYHNGTSWSTPVQIVASGEEPSIVARGSSIYLAWTTFNQVRYATFPTTAPAVVTGELIDSTTCSATHFRFPSITLVSNPCNPPIPLVGYLYDSDEQTSSPPCFNSVTSVGPRVAKRDNTLGTWGLAWSNLRTSGSTGSTVEPVSLALSSRFSSGDVYVGYSDVQNGAARTHLGHGRGATWSTPASIDTLRHHIHVRANDSASSPVGTFRIATNTDGSYDASYRDGVWAGTGALSWTSATTYTSGPPATRPHACWWKRCSAGWQTDVRVFAEEDLAVCFCPSPYLGVEYEQVSPCPSSGPISVPAFPCDKAVLATAVFNSISHGTVTVVDVADAGVIRSLSDRGATVVTPSGDTINVAWRNGKVAWSWDTGISLTGATESDVVFSSNTVNFSVQRNGPIGGFDHGPGVCTGG